MSLKNENNSRRQFLLNSAIATLGVGLLPGIVKSNPILPPAEAKACSPVTLDYYGEGPFYKADAPFISNNQIAKPTESGTRLILSGIVQTLDCTKVIQNTTIDIWHADKDGAYDNSGYNLRGKINSNTQGFYLLETILPGKYLNGSSYRPRHIHFKITPPGFPTIITQLYFEGDTDIPGDAAASIKSGTYNATNRIIPITLNAQGKYEGTWDIAIDGNGLLGIGDLHLDKGIIYSASPIPFKDEVVIHYGVYHAAKVSIQVFDIRGSLVAILNEENLEPQKYTAIWKPDQNLPDGMYWMALKLNDLQVHYLKVMKG